MASPRPKYAISILSFKIFTFRLISLSNFDGNEYSVKLINYRFLISSEFLKLLWIPHVVAVQKLIQHFLLKNTLVFKFDILAIRCLIHSQIAQHTRDGLNFDFSEIGTSYTSVKTATRSQYAHFRAPMYLTIQEGVLVQKWVFCEGLC